MSLADVDFVLLPDVITEVQEHLPQLERDLHRLVEDPDSSDLIASAFRHVHTIKGDFGYCRATPIMEFVHEIEGVLQSLREKHFSCSPLVAEALLQSMDQIQPMIDSLVNTQQFDPTPRDVLLKLIVQLGNAWNQNEADNLSRKILLSAHGAWLAEPEDRVIAPEPFSPEETPNSIIALGEQLAKGLACRQPAWRQRTRFQLAFITSLNQQYHPPSNSEALHIAVLWHDVGLLAEPDQLLLHPPTADSPDWERYILHPERSASWLLSIAPECIEAAQIIRQHHLWANGKGIAAPAYSLPPHPAAMMLAVADLLFDQVAGLTGVDYRRGVMRTLFEVNGHLDTRFDALVINAFETIAPTFSELA
ncbi:Hpt domain-containing protein [Chitinimonas sp. BJB300]|uniref:Hpt domain-containing protein n=1 Tax=Chitinimonas sp. BJB300 TaxID=1559339 RepID=UPI001304100A|nr:Hpt domain-containing protein [Chitinimonas sp. BJB300]